MKSATILKDNALGFTDQVWRTLTERLQRIVSFPDTVQLRTTLQSDTITGTTLHTPYGVTTTTLLLLLLLLLLVLLSLIVLHAKHNITNNTSVLEGDEVYLFTILNDDVWLL